MVGIIPRVDVEKLSVGYAEKIVLHDINWRVPSGTIAAIIGPNGGGKSTLLKTIVGCLKPYSGTVLIGGEQPKKARPFIAYLPQNEELDWRFPISCIDVVLQGCLSHLPWWRRPGRQELAVARESLAQVDLVPKAGTPIGQLSGGQQQRVLIARALAQDAQLILLDEPAAGLDAKAQHDLIDILEMLKARGKTVITTTHDLNCLTACFDYVLCIRGKTIFQGRPEEIMTQEMLMEVFGRHVPLVVGEGRWHEL